MVIAKPWQLCSWQLKLFPRLPATSLDATSSYFAGLALLYSDLNFPVQTVYMLLENSEERCGQEKPFLSSDNLSILQYCISAMLYNRYLGLCFCFV